VSNWPRQLGLWFCLRAYPRHATRSGGDALCKTSSSPQGRAQDPSKRRHGEDWGIKRRIRERRVRLKNSNRRVGIKKERSEEEGEV
jgi:hypothetical protein